MPRVYVSIGTNIDRAAMVRAAVAALRQRYGALRLSRVYESSAVGFDGDNFYNLVAAFDTTEAPHEVVTSLRAIEDRNGRRRDGPRFAARTLDLDLLLYGDRVMDEDGLVLPRDEITRHAFVLLPLAEIAGDHLHPGLGRSFADLWAEFAAPDQALWPVDVPGLAAEG